MVPKTHSRKNSLADVIPDWPDLKPLRKKVRNESHELKIQIEFLTKYLHCLVGKDILLIFHLPYRILIIIHFQKIIKCCSFLSFYFEILVNLNVWPKVIQLKSSFYLLKHLSPFQNLIHCFKHLFLRYNSRSYVIFKWRKFIY